jgi:hypothetical protein
MDLRGKMRHLALDNRMRGGERALPVQGWSKDQDERQEIAETMRKTHTKHSIHIFVPVTTILTRSPF